MENAVIAKNDQVIRRHQINSGVLTEFGSVVRIEADGNSALVHFPTLNKSCVVPISQLEKTSSVFSVSRVNPNPARRTIRTLIP